MLRSRPTSEARDRFRLHPRFGKDLIVRQIRRLLVREVAFMAIYEFECSACGERFEVTRPMSEHDLLKQEPPPCPKCGAIGARERAPLINTKPPSS